MSHIYWLHFLIIDPPFPLTDFFFFIQGTWFMPSTNARLSTTGEQLKDFPAQRDIMFTT